MRQKFFQHAFQLRNDNRLAQVIVEAFAQINFSHTGNRACREHDDFRFVAQNFFRAHFFQRFDTAHAGHHVVQKNYVIKIFLRQIDSVRAAVGKVRKNFVAL